MVTETLALSDSDTNFGYDDIESDYDFGNDTDKLFKLFGDSESDECSIEDVVQNQIQFRQNAGKDDMKIQIIQKDVSEEHLMKTITSNDEINSHLPIIPWAKFCLNLGISFVRFADFISRKICCDQIPTPGPKIANMLAFFPPSPWQFYYLSYEDDNGKRNYGNSKICYNKKNIKIEPVLYSKRSDYLIQVCGILRKTSTFIIHSKSGNYIVACKILATEKKRKSFHKILLVAGINAADIGGMISGLSGLIGTKQHPNEYDVYLFDYSGYGLSTGKPTEKNINNDIQSVYDYIIQERNDPELQIILLGISIGTAPTADLASKNLPYIAGLILIAPLASAVRHITFHRAPKKTSAKMDSFRTLDKAPLIKVPVLCMHGLKDDMMSATNSIQISEAAPKGLKPLLLEGEDHLSLLENSLLRIRLMKFIEEDIEK